MCDLPTSLSVRSPEHERGQYTCPAQRALLGDVLRCQDERDRWPLFASAVPSGCIVGSRTSAGRRIVKVEPLPTSLATVISPPIMRHKRRLSVSPNPVPP